MEARWHPTRLLVAALAAGFAAITMSVQSANADPSLVGEVGDDTIIIGGSASETGGTSDIGSPLDGPDGAADVDGPAYEYRLVPDCRMHNDGGTPDSGLMCAEAIEMCAENNDPSLDGTFVRTLIYQRELDRTTSEPLTTWTLVGAECRSVGPPPDDIPEESSEPNLWELIVQEWEQVTIPEATLYVQPPDGWTLVNFPTIFYTDAGEQEFPVTVLGYDVVIHAIPTEYIWRHGDDTSQTTSTPGKPYPDKEITHTYTATDPVEARVDIQYLGAASVEGGPLQLLPGTANVEGTPEPLEIVEARARLVDGR